VGPRASLDGFRKVASVYIERVKHITFINEFYMRLHVLAVTLSLIRPYMNTGTGKVM
jgi:hypothetical protein